MLRKSLVHIINVNPWLLQLFVVTQVLILQKGVSLTTSNKYLLYTVFIFNPNNRFIFFVTFVLMVLLYNLIHLFRYLFLTFFRIVYKCNLK